MNNVIYMITSCDLFENRDYGLFDSVEASVEYVNSKGIQNNVRQFAPAKDKVIVVFGFSDYNQYVYFCEKTLITPVDKKEFFRYT